MTRMKKICTICMTIFLAFIANVAGGEELIVRHAVGGKADALELYEQYWYQSLGDKLIVVRNKTGEQVASVMLTPFQAASSCKDMVICDQFLYVLLESGEVVALDLVRSDMPSVVTRTNLNDLGVFPTQLVLVDEVPFAIGKGGAVRLTDNSLLLTCDTHVTGLNRTAAQGYVYCSGGNIMDADTDEVLGVAETIVALDEDANADIGASVYTRSLGGQTEIGLLSRHLLALGTASGRIVLDGELQNVLSRSSRLIVTTDSAVYVVGIAPDELRVLQTFEVSGVRDTDIIASNYLAMCGEFGRGIFRIDNDRGGFGGQLIRIVPAMNSMAPGVSDARGVYVQSGDTSFRYGFNQTVTELDTPAMVIEVPTKAVVLGLETSIVEESGAVEVIDRYGTTTLDFPSRATTVSS